MQASTQTSQRAGMERGEDGSGIKEAGWEDRGGARECETKLRKWSLEDCKVCKIQVKCQ